MPFPRPLGMSTKKDAPAGTPFQPTPVRASNPNNNDQRQGIIMAMVSCLWCYISLFFHGRVWYTRLSSTNRNLTKECDYMGKAILAAIVTLIAGYLGMVVGLELLGNWVEFGLLIAIAVMGAFIIYFNDKK